MQKIKLSDYIAEYLSINEVEYIFGIIGSANAHLFDSIYSHKRLKLICMHHEQACIMAAHGYYMQSGKMAAVLVTAGAGTTNALTGVVGAFADSVPILIISGQESTKQYLNNNISRMIGIQGVFTESIFESCTKRVSTCQSVSQTINELENCFKTAITGRFGPCMLDIPIDLQGAKLDFEPKLFNSLKKEEFSLNNETIYKIDDFITNLKNAKKPLIWIGNGLRGLDSKKLRSIIEEINIPYLTSWTATDIFDPIDELYAGHAGTYGSRAGNLFLQSCDLLLTLGTRIAIPQKGYVDSEFAREASIYVVEIDINELNKLSSKFANKINSDAKLIINEIHKRLKNEHLNICNWLIYLKKLKEEFPLLEPCHKESTKSFINSYLLVHKLGLKAKKNTTFVTDMGTALISGFQILEPRYGQKLFTSQGLGEMGYGLPGAIGAWFASKNRTIICLNCDGGLMMNLQDLQTVSHHNIPLKIIIFNNDGYLMIKHTQDAIVSGRRSGTDKNSGISCPDYKKIAESFGLKYLSLSEESKIEHCLEIFIEEEKAIILEVFMPPNQLLVPKLAVSISPEGEIISPPLEDLKPFISMDRLKKYLQTEIHPNSRKINRE